MSMANLYYVEMLVKGRKSDLDELQAILQEEIDGGQSHNDYYTFHRSVKAMGFDPESVPEHRAFTDSLQRMDDDVLWVMYAGAWNEQPGVMQSIHQRWIIGRGHSLCPVRHRSPSIRVAGSIQKVE